MSRYEETKTTTQVDVDKDDNYLDENGKMRTDNEHGNEAKGAAAGAVAGGLAGAAVAGPPGAVVGGAIGAAGGAAAGEATEGHDEAAYAENRRADIRYVVKR